MTDVAQALLQRSLVLTPIPVLTVLTGELFLGLIALLLVRILGAFGDITQVLRGVEDNDS